MATALLFVHQLNDTKRYKSNIDLYGSNAICIQVFEIHVFISYFQAIAPAVMLMTKENVVYQPY